MRHAPTCRRGSGCRRPPRDRGTPPPSARRRAATCSDARVVERLAGQRELGGAPLQVVAPRRLRVERVGQRGGDVGLGHVRRLRAGEDPRLPVASSRRARAGSSAAWTWAASANAAAIRPARLGGSRVPGSLARNAGRDAQVPVLAAAERVVDLGQPPQVVIAVERALRCCPSRSRPGGTASRSAGPRPARASPAPKRRLGSEVGRRRRAQLPIGEVQQADGVGRRVRELDEVAGVEPAARQVHVAVDPVEGSADDRVAVRVS